MWKGILEALLQIVRLTADTQQNRQDIKALEKRLLEFAAATEAKIHELVIANERLSNEFRRLADELKSQRAYEEYERKILKLELETHLLRQERGLPPAKPQPLPEPEVGDQKEGTEKVDEN